MSGRITPILHGIVHAGKLCLDESAERMLQRLIQKFEGKEVEMRLTVVRKNRSLNQNAYFHGVILPLISDHTGYEPEEVKDILKQMFLLIDDGKYPRTRHTSDLDTAEMAHFIDRCIRWAATELNVVIPDPEQVGVA